MQALRFKTLIQTLSCQLISTPMKLLFTFEQDYSIRRILLQLERIYLILQDVKNKKILAC